MKLDSPTIYVLHKVDGKLAKSAFNFTGRVDRRRVKREIIKAFRRGGEIVNPLFIDECINASLRVSGVEGRQVIQQVALASITDAEDAQLVVDGGVLASDAFVDEPVSWVHTPGPASMDTTDNRELARKQYWENHPDEADPDAERKQRISEDRLAYEKEKHAAAQKD